MALFDEIKVSDELLAPLGAKGAIYQTQSMKYPYLDKYRISPDARLERQDAVTGEWSDVIHHGDVEFYSSKGDDFRRYIARFTEGRLVRIWRVDARQRGE
ncbi:hypothetical protein KKE60_04595 [Patescibacteria group bacterium]|nr:hypothetical protein [Patescibacteria group bacterium]